MTEKKPREAITVILSFDEPLHLHPFYCCKCSKIVARITGDVVSLVAGEPEMSDAKVLGHRIEAYCRGTIWNDDGTKTTCNAKYIF